MPTPFNADYGTSQGRIAPTDGPPFEGTEVYQLGHGLPGQLREFNDGDFHQIDQSATFDTNARTLRLRARIRPPASMQPGTGWTLFLRIDGHNHANIDLLPGGPVRILGDIGASISTATVGGGAHDVAIRLLYSGTGNVDTVELPGVAVDALIQDTTVEHPGVFNRNPEPDETRVPLDASLVFDVYDTEGGTVDSSRTTIAVNGAVVFMAGSPAGGWSLGAAPPHAPNATRFILTPSSPFLPITTYTVRVLSAVVGGPDNALDVSWSFTTVDTTAPRVISALATDDATVLVTFSKAMAEGSPPGVHDATNPANYTIALVSQGPAVTPSIASIGSGPGGVVALAMSDPLTAGAVYRVTVSSSVQDTLGNAMGFDPIDNSATFVWLGCPQPAGRDASLWKLLPQGARSADVTGDLRRFITCMQLVYDELLCDVDRWPSILDPDTAPEPFVDAMLEDLGNPFTEFVLDLVHKRQLVRLLVPLCGLKGTDPGMIDAIRLFTGVEVTITCPAWQGVWTLGVSLLGGTTVLGSTDPHDLYTFFVVSPVVLTDAQRAAIRLIVAYMRRAPCHLGGIIEPTPPTLTPGAWQLGLSLLGTETVLH